MNHWEMALGAVMVVVLLLVLVDIFSTAGKSIAQEISRAERAAFSDLIDRVEKMRAISPKDVLPHGDTQVIDLADWKANRARSEKAKEQPRPAAGRFGSTGAAPVGARPEPKKQATVIASQASVSQRSVERALELRKKNPKAFEAVCRGELPGRKALEAAEEEHPPTTRRSQPDSLYARLLRASIEGPRDQK